MLTSAAVKWSSRNLASTFGCNALILWNVKISILFEWGFEVAEGYPMRFVGCESVWDFHSLSVISSILHLGVSVQLCNARNLPVLANFSEGHQSLMACANPRSWVHNPVTTLLHSVNSVLKEANSQTCVMQEPPQKIAFGPIGVAPTVLPKRAGSNNNWNRHFSTVTDLLDVCQSLWDGNLTPWIRKDPNRDTLRNKIRDNPAGLSLAKVKHTVKVEQYKFPHSMKFNKVNKPPNRFLRRLFLNQNTQGSNVRSCRGRAWSPQGGWWERWLQRPGGEDSNWLHRSLNCRRWLRRAIKK